MGFWGATIELIAVLLKSVYAVLYSIFRCIIPEPLKCVRDKVILITGAGGGLGRLLSEKFALLGARVVLVDVDETRNNETLQSIKQMQCKAYAYTCDISNENQVAELHDKVKRTVGDVEILINNAGIMAGRPLMELSSEQIKRTLNINTLAHFWTIRQFLPRMLENGEGHIVAIASVAGILGCSNLVDYCTSKFAVMGLMSALREELYDTGKEDFIQMTVICPSTMNTGMVQSPKTKFPSVLPILNVEDVSDIVVNSVLRNKRIVVIPTFAHAIYKIANLFPSQVPVHLQRYFEYGMEPNVRTNSNAGSKEEPQEDQLGSLFKESYQIMDPILCGTYSNAGGKAEPQEHQLGRLFKESCQSQEPKLCGSYSNAGSKEEPQEYLLGNLLKESYQMKDPILCGISEYSVWNSMNRDKVFIAHNDSDSFATSSSLSSSLSSLLATSLIDPDTDETLSLLDDVSDIIRSSSTETIESISC